MDYLVSMLNTESKKLEDEQGITNKLKIIAKLESVNAIESIESILKEADSILIPRGILGTILPIEKISWI